MRTMAMFLCLFSPPLFAVEKCTLASVKWLDAIIYTKADGLLDNKTPDQILTENPNVSIGCVKEYEKSILIVFSFSTNGGETKPESFLIVPRGWIVSIVPLGPVKETKGADKPGQKKPVVSRVRNRRPSTRHLLVLSMSGRRGRL